MGCLDELASANTIIAFEVLGSSGVSSASALSAGDDSAPDVSENKSGSKALRGVVKEGLRNGAAGVEDVAVKVLLGCEDSIPPAQDVSLLHHEVASGFIRYAFVIRLL